MSKDATRHPLTVMVLLCVEVLLVVNYDDDSTGLCTCM